MDRRSAVLLTDEHLYKFHQAKFTGWNVIVLKAGEQYKIQATADAILEKLLEMGADRSTMLIGVGGGVVTDLTGYVAAVYMRGLSFGFVPTTLLALVDASVGGKNGVNHGALKNMVGTIRQPAFLLVDYSFLRTLPLAEWQNGFAEIIKHAAIKDLRMMKELNQNDLAFYQKNKKALAALIQKNVEIKVKVVQKDEFEHGDRKLLNFGHTLGHAIENEHALLHGHAISIGMVYAAKISQVLLGFTGTGFLVETLKKYGLPTAMHFDIDAAMGLMQKDKKKANAGMQYVLLSKIGKGVYETIPMKTLQKLIKLYS